MLCAETRMKCEWDKLQAHENAVLWEQESLYDARESSVTFRAESAAHVLRYNGDLIHEL